jgi:tRNA nucleotidyltransferase (CCA-adding enzyme)
VTVHERFGTATVTAPDAVLDLAGARRERYERPGALPDVELGATIAEDLARRDFTVNAIALRLADGELVPHPGALDDLEAGVLRVLHGASFADDPTRLLRLARYAARLGFAPDPQTDALAAAATIATVTGARLGAELRLLLREPQPAALLELRRHDLGRALLGRCEPRADRIERAIALTPPDGRADLAALATTELETARLDALAFPAHERDVVAAAAERGPRLAALRGTDADLWRALRKEAPETVAVAGALGAADAARRWLDVVRHRRLAIDGNDLVAAGLSGPAVGAALAAATEAMLDGRAPSRAEQLAVALGS